MKLWLVRHAEAEYRQGIVDKNRNLTDFGKHQAQNLAKYLCASIDKPDQIFASTYSRAQQTANIIADKLDLEVITLPDITPKDTVDRILQHLATFTRNSLVVTHQPLWSKTFKSLMQEESYRDVHSSGMAILEGEIFVPGALNLKEIITGFN